MADEELNLHISATDGTDAALSSISQRFRRQHAEIQRGVVRLADGTKVFSHQIQRQADAMGVSYKDLFGHINANAAAAARMGGTLRTAGAQGVTAVSGMGRAISSANAGLLTMAGRFGGVAAAIEVARRGVVGYADFDLALRHVQNQTGLTKAGMKALGDEVVRLQAKTGIAKAEILGAFDEFRERSNMAPEAVMKLLPDLLQMAQGINAPIKSTFAFMASSMRILKIEAKDLPAVFNATSHAVNELQLDLNKMTPHMSRLASAGAARGYTGVEGFQKIITMTGVIKTEQDDAADAALRLINILERMDSDELAKKLQFDSGYDLSNWLKAQEDQVGSLLDLISRADDQTQHEIFQSFGIKDKAAFRVLMDALKTYRDELKKTQEARGALERGENIRKAPQTQINRLSAWLSQKSDELGEILYGLLESEFGEFGPDDKKLPSAARQRRRARQNEIAPAPTTPAPAPAPTTPAPGSWSERRARRNADNISADKINFALDETADALLDFSATVNKEAVLIKASLSGTGTGYGGSADSRFLRANYSPGGGGGGGGGIGPGGTGTGYGGGTTVAPSYGGGGSPAAPGGRFNQPAPEAPPSPGSPGVGSARGRVLKGGDPRGMEQHIRETAKKYGIDPDTAVAVAKSEGLSTFQSSVPRTGKGSYNGREDSWGAYQMYMGGGLGNQFQKDTGLDPRDPANEKATIDYALKHASKHGWGAWHGAKNTGIGRFAGIGGQPGVGPARGWVAPSGPGAPGDSAAPAAPEAPGAPGLGIAPGQEGMGPTPGQDPRSIPYHQQGTIEMEGQTYRYGSGGAGRGSTPAGSYPINIAREYGGQGELGPIGRSIGSIATVGGLGGTYQDPRYGTPRAGVQIHSASANSLDKLYSQGCFAIHPKDWPRYRAHLLDMHGRTPGGLRIDVGKDGRASIVARGSKIPTPNDTSAGVPQPRGADNQAPSEIKMEGTGETRYRHDLPGGGHTYKPERPAAPSVTTAPSNVSEPNTGTPSTPAAVPTEHEARVNLNVNDTQVQFARTSMRRQADREVREARWNSYSDIGAA